MENQQVILYEQRNILQKLITKIIQSQINKKHNIFWNLCFYKPFSKKTMNKFKCSFFIIDQIVKGHYLSNFQILQKFKKFSSCIKKANSEELKNNINKNMNIYQKKSLKQFQKLSFSKISKNMGDQNKIFQRKNKVTNVIIIDKENDTNYKLSPDRISQILYLLSKKYKQKIDEDFFNEQIKYYLVKNNIQSGKLYNFINNEIDLSLGKQNKNEYLNKSQKLIMIYLSIQMYYPLDIITHKKKQLYNRHFFFNLQSINKKLLLQEQQQKITNLLQNIKKKSQIKKKIAFKILQKKTIFGKLEKFIKKTKKNIFDQFKLNDLILRQKEIQKQKMSQNVKKFQKLFDKIYLKKQQEIFLEFKYIYHNLQVLEVVDITHSIEAQSVYENLRLQELLSLKENEIEKKSNLTKCSPNLYTSNFMHKYNGLKSQLNNKNVSSVASLLNRKVLTVQHCSQKNLQSAQKLNNRRKRIKIKMKVAQRHTDNICQKSQRRLNNESTFYRTPEQLKQYQIRFTEVQKNKKCTKDLVSSIFLDQIIFKLYHENQIKF